MKAAYYVNKATKSAGIAVFTLKWMIIWVDADANLILRYTWKSKLILSHHIMMVVTYLVLIMFLKIWKYFKILMKIILAVMLSN